MSMRGESEGRKGRRDEKDNEGDKRIKDEQERGCSSSTRMKPPSHQEDSSISAQTMCVHGGGGREGFVLDPPGTNKLS